ncbi:hypothetical protein ElyMa_003745300 [Elysia marginata]|uniref:Uncharacterized protein n=1 Tax=Elysia marginata TaxID=1093978 RepID=A0AAV4F716_9GAST|nr:hypothetical protein ElyMa_003745300 [Elysia marginata]
MWSTLVTPDSTIFSGDFCLFIVCVAADVDAEVSIGDDNDDNGDYYYDDFATHVHDDDDEDYDKISAVDDVTPVQFDGVDAGEAYDSGRR